MNGVLKVFLSMSVSGGLLILLLFLGRRFFKGRISRQWQYYIWLAVILRLLLPFGPETSLLGKTYRAVDEAITRTAILTQQTVSNTLGEHPVPAAGVEPDNERPAEDLTAARPLRDIGALLTEHIGLIWLMAALGLLIRKVTVYQGFIRYIKAGMTPVDDTGMLDQLATAAERAGVNRPVELCVKSYFFPP